MAYGGYSISMTNDVLPVAKNFVFYPLLTSALRSAMMMKQRHPAERNRMAEEKTYGAKQIASRIGTDGKTLRKFLRSSASPYDPVGQGGRYDFPQSMLPLIKREFEQWQKAKRVFIPKDPQIETKPTSPSPE